MLTYLVLLRMESPERRGELGTPASLECGFFAPAS